MPHLASEMSIVEYMGDTVSTELSRVERTRSNRTTTCIEDTIGKGHSVYRGYTGQARLVYRGHED